MVKDKFLHIKMEIDIEASLKDGFSLNSLTMIQMLVEIEKMYDIEFEDEELNFNKFHNFRELIENVYKKINLNII